MFNPNTLQPLHGKYISGWMSQSSPTVRHDSVFKRISGVQNGSAFQLANKEHTQTVQDETLLKNNLVEVTPSRDAKSSSFHSSQPKICRSQRYSTEFVNTVKQELLTHTVREVVEQHGLPRRTVYNWANGLDGAREKIKQNNIRNRAKQSRFHTLIGLKKYCLGRVDYLCSQQQNLRTISDTKIISQVAKEEGINRYTLINWIVRARSSSSDSGSVSQLPKSTPDETHSVKNVQPHQSVNGHSDAHQLNAQSNIDPVNLWANKSSTAPPTVLTDSTDDGKVEKSFEECLQDLIRWQDEHLRRM